MVPLEGRSNFQPWPSRGRIFFVSASGDVDGALLADPVPGEIALPRFKHGLDSSNPTAKGT